MNSSNSELHLQTLNLSQTRTQPKEKTMPKYIIERTIPGAANLTNNDLQSIAQQSCNVLEQLGPQIQWVQSYVAGDKFYCIYIASNKELIRKHARCGQFPADLISEVKAIVDPTSAEESARYSSTAAVAIQQHRLG
jgi:hypothetical protein